MLWCAAVVPHAASVVRCAPVPLCLLATARHVSPAAKKLINAVMLYGVVSARQGEIMSDAVYVVLMTVLVIVSAAIDVGGATSSVAA